MIAASGLSLQRRANYALILFYSPWWQPTLDLYPAIGISTTYRFKFSDEGSGYSSQLSVHESGLTGGLGKEIRLELGFATTAVLSSFLCCILY